MQENVILGFDIRAGGGHHEQQYCVSLYMPQEPQTETFAFARTLDDTRYIRHTEGPAVPVRDDTELGSKGGEGIVGYLGLGCGYHAQQGGFAGIGEPH